MAPLVVRNLEDEVKTTRLRLARGGTGGAPRRPFDRSAAHEVALMAAGQRREGRSIDIRDAQTAGIAAARRAMTSTIFSPGSRASASAMSS